MSTLWTNPVYGFHAVNLTGPGTTYSSVIDFHEALSAFGFQATFTSYEGAGPITIFLEGSLDNVGWYEVTNPAGLAPPDSAGNSVTPTWFIPPLINPARYIRVSATPAAGTSAITTVLIIGSADPVSIAEG